MFALSREPRNNITDCGAVAPIGVAPRVSEEMLGEDTLSTVTNSRPPSMADVAALAGVSHQTVSRVLNGNAHVRPETRDRVASAIDQLGYRRNQAARTLVTSRSATVGIVATNTTHFGPASTVLAIELAARRAGLFVSIATLTSWAPRDVASAIDQLMSQGVDGIVVVAPIDEVARELDRLSTRIPIVAVAARRNAPMGSAVAYVSVDQHAGASRATQHLLDLGHTKLAHIAGPPGWFDATERARGFAEQAVAAGAQTTTVRAEGWDARCGFEAGLRLAEEVTAGRVSAVIAGNDYLALGAIRALGERRIRVPQDVSIVGFDDIDGSAFLVPALTTVHQPFADLGGAAIDTLLRRRAPAQIVPEVVVRESTAPTRS